MNRLLGLAIAVFIVHPGSAYADDDRPSVPLAPVPAPAPAQVAPLSQQTQTTSVPQSGAPSSPEEIKDIEDDQLPPAGYTAVQRPIKGLLSGGAASLGVSYGLCLLWSAFFPNAPITQPNGPLWVPIAGPFIQMAVATTPSATEDAIWLGLGITQVAGAVMMYYGLTTTKRVFVRNDLVVMPMVGNGTSGFALSGRF